MGTLTSNATVTIAINSAPVAGDDAYAVSPNSTLSEDASHGVLFNDTDADFDSLSATVLSGPSHGSLSLNSDGSFSYTPDSNFLHGFDHFTYVASDGVASSTATVTIAVGNNAPVANGTTLGDVP